MQRLLLTNSPLHSDWLEGKWSKMIANLSQILLQKKKKKEKLQLSQI